MLTNSSLAFIYNLAETAGVPVDIGLLAKAAGVSRVVRAETPGAGMLMREEGGITVVLNSADTIERQRFSYAHEIAHILTGTADRHNINHVSDVSTFDALDDYRSSEAQCERIAAKLLMPEKAFRARLEKSGVCIETILALSKEFQASIPAVTLRVAEIGVEPFVAILWSVKGRPSSTPKLRVTWYTSTYKMAGLRKYYIPRHKPAEKDCVAARAYAGDDEIAVRGCENFNLGNLRGVFYVEALAKGSTHKRYTISLIFPERQPAGDPKPQLSLL